MSDNVVPLKPEFGQMQLPGMPVASIGIELKSTKNSLPVVDRVLTPGTHVSGTFDGRVIFPKYDMDTGKYTNVIEILTAELSEEA